MVGGKWGVRRDSSIPGGVYIADGGGGGGW